MKRFLLAAACGSVAAIAALGACTFVDVTYADPDGTGEGGPASETGAGDVRTDTLDAASADEPGEPLLDGSSPDALISKDSGGMPIDASACGPTDCDCDDDGYKNTLKSGCDDGTPTDCDDLDPRTHPGQLYLEDKAGPPQGGDWNCSGKPETLYSTSVTCEGLTLGLGCSNIFGFSDVPQCGEKGTWIRCTRPNLLSLACAIGQTSTLTQACK